MRKLFTILVVVLISASVFAQSPQKMSYQALIRNSSNALVINQAVGMQISILQGSSTGTEVYTETQTPSTNANGLVSIEIGGGVGFNSIDWANGPYFIKTETDPTGSTNYTITGTSQLLSVPYALHAKTAESITGTITETDPAFTAWDKSTGITITESQISDLVHPAYTAGSGIDITSGVISSTTGAYTAGSGIDITSGVISTTGSSSMPEYAYAYIGNSSTLGNQALTSMFPSSTYVNGLVMNGSTITLHANKMYEVTVAFYIYNASGGHTFKMKDVTNSAYLGTELYFGQGGSDVSYNISTTNFLFKPSTDVQLALEKTQGTDVNLIGKIVVKEIK